MSSESNLSAQPATEVSPPGAAQAELQFDQVEPVAGAAAQLVCNSCKQPIADHYWELNGQPSCAVCREVLVRHFTGPISWSTWGRVLLTGGGAALLGALIYFAVLKLTGYELGLIAIVVGYLVGSGVRKAANYRGGWKLQAVAIALTYASVVSAYMPAVYKGLVEGEKEKAAQTAQTNQAARGGSVGAAASGSAAATATPPASEPVAAAAQPDSAVAKKSLGAAIGGLFLAMLLLFFLACMAPFFAGVSNFMGWIIIGIALYEAWKLNRRVPLVVTGPFAVTAGAAAPAAQAG